MKSLFAFFVVVLLISCSNKEEVSNSNILENLSYTIDTVVIDPGEEMFNLKFGLGAFSLSPDEKTLYRYNYQQRVFDEVDLENLKLVGKHQFEPEGPNGIGFFSNFKVDNGGNFFIPDGRNPGVFNKKGELINPMALKPDKIRGLEDQEPITQMGSEVIWNASTGKLIAVKNGPFQDSIRLVTVDTKSLSGKMYQMPALEFAKAFDLVWMSEDSGALSNEPFFLHEAKGRIYISTAASSGVYVFDPMKENLSFVPIAQQSLENQKTREVPENIKDQEQFKEELDKLLTQTSYQKLFWNERDERFYRLASRLKVPSVEGAPSKIELFLLLYDQNLKPIGEASLGEHGFNNQNYFFKDGKLWSYVNVEDELGFAVMELKF